MRRTFRLLASVKPARYLEAGTPTGLTGLYTHPSPRSTLLFLYSTTLDKLKAVPEHSVYRQSVEALTKHRMAIVEGAVPPGYDEWAAKARKLLADEIEQKKTREALAQELEKSEKELSEIEARTASEAENARALRVAGLRSLLAEIPEQPEHADIVISASDGDDAAVRVERGGQTFFIRHLPKVVDEREQEWDGHFDPDLEGVRSVKATKTIREKLEAALKAELDGTSQTAKPAPQASWEPEPQLTAEQYVHTGAYGDAMIGELTVASTGFRRLRIRLVLA